MEDGEAHTYTALVGNLMRRLAHNGQSHVLLGGSVGFAPDVPATTAASRATHWAWQATANVIDFGPLGQSIGVVYMKTGSGWLLSPDLASNSWLSEVRYRLVPLRGLTCEVRLRFRGDAEQLSEASRTRFDRDWYLRLSWRF